MRLFTHPWYWCLSFLRLLDCPCKRFLKKIQASGIVLLLWLAIYHLHGCSSSWVIIIVVVKPKCFSQVSRSVLWTRFLCFLFSELKIISQIFFLVILWGECNFLSCWSGQSSSDCVCPEIILRLHVRPRLTQVLWCSRCLGLLPSRKITLVDVVRDLLLNGFPCAMCAVSDRVLGMFGSEPWYSSVVDLTSTASAHENSQNVRGQQWLCRRSEQDWLVQFCLGYLLQKQLFRWIAGFVLFFLLPLWLRWVLSTPRKTKTCGCLISHDWWTNRKETKPSCALTRTVCSLLEYSDSSLSFVARCILILGFCTCKDLGLYHTGERKNGFARW